MRRFCIILLLCLMPLQSIWAAGHFCTLTHKHDGEPHHAMTHDTHADHASPMIDDASTGDCAEMHCHALHAVALPRADAVLQLPASPRPAAGPPHALAGRFSAEIDRPNWRQPA
jgi:hypothetical protein